MTATLTEPRATMVPCHLCRKDFPMALDDLRAIVEHGGQPHCGCNPAKPEKKKKGATVRPAATKAEHLLYAINDLEERHCKAPTVSAIIVSAWRAAPAAFGLVGYEAEFPDSNRVIMELVKMKGHGLLSQPGEKLYQLTRAGLASARLLLAPRGKA